MTPTAEVIEHYRYQWLLSRGSPRKAPHFYYDDPTSESLSGHYKKEDEEAVEKYLAWCLAKSVDPLLFITFRFQHLKPKGLLPKLDRLKSEKVLALFEEYGEGKLLHARMEKKLASEMIDYTETSLRGLADAPTESEEYFKRTFLSEGKAKLCLFGATRSGGFHPRSVWCGRCSEAVACSAQLNGRSGFDVSALRSGRVQALPPEIAAKIASL
jgi:hypothetical protein